jgi:hypothetical protein
VKKSPEEEKHFTQRRKGLEGAKKTKLLFFACLCVFAPWRELFDFFTRPNPRDLCPICRQPINNPACTLHISALLKPPPVT